MPKRKFRERCDVCGGLVNIDDAVFQMRRFKDWDRKWQPGEEQRYEEFPFEAIDDGDYAQVMAARERLTVDEFLEWHAKSGFRLCAFHPTCLEEISA